VSITQKNQPNTSDQGQQKLDHAPPISAGVKRRANKTGNPEELTDSKNLSETSESNRQLINRRVSTYDVVIDCLLKVNSR
jgi:hypothetical protein